MTKRARWNGPHAINVFAGDDLYLTNPLALDLQPGQLLPTEAVDGTPIPASVRDEMLQRDDWSEVDQADQTKKKDGDK